MKLIARLSWQCLLVFFLGFKVEICSAAWRDGQIITFIQDGPSLIKALQIDKSYEGLSFKFLCDSRQTALKYASIVNANNFEPAYNRVATIVQVDLSRAKAYQYNRLIDIWAVFESIKPESFVEHARQRISWEFHEFDKMNEEKHAQLQKQYIKDLEAELYALIGESDI